MGVIKKALLVVAGFLPVLAVVPVRAASTTVVAPSNASVYGWSDSESRTNGEVSYVSDSDIPLGDGALSLVTGEATGSPLQDKANYLTTAHAGTKLTDVTALGYWTKQVSASFPAGLPSYQMEIDADGVVDPLNPGQGYATLVFEPYNNFGNGVVQNNVWQEWDVDAGTFWSTRNVSELTPGLGGLSNGFGGPPFYSLADLKAKFPNAVVLRVGVNVGSNNPNWDTRVDGFTFNDTTYDFEVSLPPVTLDDKEDCKNGGWKLSEAPVFKNQGDCVSYFASKGKAKGNPAVAAVARLFR